VFGRTLLHLLADHLGGQPRHPLTEPERRAPREPER